MRCLFYPILTKLGMYGQIIVKLPDIYENTFSSSPNDFFSSRVTGGINSLSRHSAELRPNEKDIFIMPTPPPNRDLSAVIRNSFVVRDYGNHQPTSISL